MNEILLRTLARIGGPVVASSVVPGGFVVLTFAPNVNIFRTMRDEARVFLHRLRCVDSLYQMLSWWGLLCLEGQEYAMGKTKRNSLLFLSISGLLLLILAMSLPNLVLAPGERFSLREPLPQVAEPEVVIPGGQVLLWIFQGIAALAVILLPFYIVYSLLTSEGRQRLLADIIVVVLLFAVASYLGARPLVEDGQQQVIPLGDAEDLRNVSVLPPARFPENPPVWVALLVILSVSALIAAIAFMVLWFIRQRAPRSIFPEDLVAEAAQRTIESLQGGDDFRVVILQCYREMSRVVRDQRGMAREIAMTPREFTDRLVSGGLPREPIETLTRLFEQVRYGKIRSGAHEESLAIACLNEIVNACKTIGHGHDGQ